METEVTLNDPNLTTNYHDDMLRDMIFETSAYLVEGRIPYGVWSCSAPPGGYKSTLFRQLAHHITYGSPLPGLDWTIARHGDTLMIVPDETAQEMQAGSLAITPWGNLPSDGTDEIDPNRFRITITHQPHGADLKARIAWLLGHIEAQEAETGRKIVLVVWDTLGSLLGSPNGVNAYEHAAPIQDLNHWFAETGRVLALTNHIGKDGSPIGTVGIDGYSNLVTKLDMNPADDTGIMTVQKMRGGRKWEAALEARNGLLSFTDLSPQAAVHGPGTNPRAVANYLAQFGPTPSPHIAHDLDISPNRVREALCRMKAAGEVEKEFGGQRWFLTPKGTVCDLPIEEKTWTVCRVCQLRIHPSGDNGSGQHMMCEGGQLGSVPIEPPPLPHPPQAPHPPQVPHLPHQRGGGSRWDPPAQDETDHGFSGLRELKASIGKSRMHPLPCVPPEHRRDDPWRLMSEYMGGEPWKSDWHGPEQPDGELVVLDRNGSYPSACSSVKVAPNKLIHTGTAAYSPTAAGIYLIELPAWSEQTMPHPLGHMAYVGDPMVWITTPHMVLLHQLAKQGRIALPDVADSFTGRANGSLFEAFYKSARATRETLVEAGGEPYTDYKISVSKALRVLWPKEAKSPFWRPDWRLSIVAEASVRHWIRADEAQRAGIPVMQLNNVDEVVLWTKDGKLPKTSPYKIGTAFGHVKIKHG